MGITENPDDGAECKAICFVVFNCFPYSNIPKRAYS